MRAMPASGRPAPRIGAEPQVFLDRQAGHGAAPFRHVGDAEARDRFGRAPFQPLPGEMNFALAAHHAGNGAQRRGFAGAIGAEQHAHAAVLDGNVDAVQNLGLAVERLDGAQLEDRRHQCFLPR